jgi:GntR family transcriptional regulator, transcriptional repressor for pyruvate dehydrogenase complex
VEASFEPVAARRTFEEAVAQIAGKVEAGELRPGDRLPPERALASRMRISRPTLREAVRVLVDARVLEVRRGHSGGIVVISDVVPRALVRARSELRVGEVAGVLEARRLLEPRVAQLAAVYAREDDFAALQRTIERQREVAGDPDFLRHEDRFLQLDLQFHLTIARATGNSTVVSLVSALFRRLAIARDMAIHMPLVPDWAVEIHERTLAAIRAGDFDQIDAVMDEHLAKLEQTWEREVRRPPVRALPPFLRR